MGILDFLRRKTADQTSHTLFIAYNAAKNKYPNKSDHWLICETIKNRPGYSEIREEFIDLAVKYLKDDLSRVAAFINLIELHLDISKRDAFSPAHMFPLTNTINKNADKLEKR